MKIINLHARQILDSRGNPAVEAEAKLEDGSVGRFSCPSGASTGQHEAHELRDGGTEFGGKGVSKAVNNINTVINGALAGMDANSQEEIDNKLIQLDGTENKSNLGANAILSASLSVAKACAMSKGMAFYGHINFLAGSPEMSLPMPMMNVLNGGQHASNSSDFQEFMIIPRSASSITEAVKIGSEVFHSLKKQLSQSGHSTAVGDEGGFTLEVSSNSEMLDLLVSSVEASGFKVVDDVVFAIDVAASEFFNDGVYELTKENQTVSEDEMIQYLSDLHSKYPLVSIEDGLSEDEWSGWTKLTSSINTQIVGDDLLVTNPKRLQRAIDEKAANSILIKLNQIGTLTETLNTINLAKDNSFTTVISHRSGETEDTTIAHLAVGTGAGQIKTGSLSRSDRTAKYNELIRIEEENSKIHLRYPL